MTMSQLKRDRARLARQRSKMQGEYKQFDREIYSETNQRAIEAVLAHLEHEGLYALPNDDLFGPDVVVYRGFRPAYYVEVEMKLVWKADQDFPFQSVQLPERKRKFMELGLPVEFWILRADAKVSVIIPDYVVKEDILVEVPNRLVPSGELFYQVPISECIVKEL